MNESHLIRGLSLTIRTYKFNYKQQIIIQTANGKYAHIGRKLLILYLITIPHIPINKILYFNNNIGIHVSMTGL